MSALGRHHLRAELADGRVFDLDSIVFDQIAWEETRYRRKWPGVSDQAVVLWWSFLCWSAATRLGEFDGTWETWRAELVDVENLDPDDEPPATVDPTNPAPPPNS